MLLTAAILLMLAVRLYAAQDRDRLRALLAARPVALDRLGEAGDGTLVAVHALLAGEPLIAPVSGRPCVWWSVTRFSVVSDKDKDGGTLDTGDGQRLPDGVVSSATLRLGDIALLDPATLKALDTYSVGAQHVAERQTHALAAVDPSAEATWAVEYRLEAGAAVTAVGRVCHRADGMHALLPPRGEPHVRLFRHGIRSARVRALLREGAAWLCAAAALTLVFAA